MRVDVSQMPRGADFLDGAAPTEKTIASGSATAELWVRTDNDNVDEADGTITATVQTSTGYAIESPPPAASVAVLDNDAPPAPAGLRANGNIVGGEVSIWWQASTAATAYDLRYAVETCSETPQETAAACTPGSWTEVNGITSTNKNLSAGTSSGIQLQDSTLYRIQVRGTNAHDRSNWSTFAFVYPTSDPPRFSRRLVVPLPPSLPSPFISDPPDIGTAPLYGYQRNSEFRFAVCDGTIPSGVSITAVQIEAAIGNWEDAVIRDRSGNSLIETTRHHHPTPLPASGCQPPNSLVGVLPIGSNEVIFVNDDVMHDLHCTDGSACWRSNTWDTDFLWSHLGLLGGLPSIARGTILLRETRSHGSWNDSVHGGGCTYLEHTLAHETGHALGIGWPLNDHPRNAELSIMSSGYTHTTRYCEPQAYDIVTIMANYQSRPAPAPTPAPIPTP